MAGLVNTPLLHWGNLPVREEVQGSCHSGGVWRVWEFEVFCEGRKVGLPHSEPMQKGLCFCAMATI